MTTSELLQHYEAMRQLSQRMLDAAKKSEWGLLVELEQTRSDIEQRLKESDQATWTGKEAIRKSELIRNILDADEATRTLTLHWMSEMQKSLDSIHTGKKLKQAYAGG